jgi:hypothetical protein
MESARQWKPFRKCSRLSGLVTEGSTTPVAVALRLNRFFRTFRESNPIVPSWDTWPGLYVNLGAPAQCLVSIASQNLPLFRLLQPHLNAVNNCPALNERDGIRKASSPGRQPYLLVR